MAHTFAGRKPANFIATVYCAASHTPILPCAGKKVQKSDCFHDGLGYHWCPEHAERGRLLNWAKEHDYPGIAFTIANGEMCAIGYPGGKVANNEEMWILAILQSKDEVVEAAVQYVATTTSQDDELVV